VLNSIRTMFAAAVNRIAVTIVSAAANKLEAAAAVEKAGVDADLEAEASRLEAGGFVKQAQTLRLRAGGIQADAPGATALAALAHLTGDEPPALSAAPDVPQLPEASANPARRGPGRPPKAVAKADDATGG
jgi:hypothetical protein